jgi:hypothetical protein
MRWGTYMTLSITGTFLAGLAITAVVLRDLWWGDWWFAGIVLSISTVAFLYGVFRERGNWTEYKGLTVREAHERLQQEPVRENDLRMWRRTTGLLLLSAVAIPPLVLYVGMGRGPAAILGGLALCGAASSAIVHRRLRTMARADASSDSTLNPPNGV